MSFDIALPGRRALVTGGSRGIGRAVCRYLARAGADVAIGYRNDRSAAEEVLGLVEGEGVKGMTVGRDVSVPAEAAAAVDDATHGLGGVDILVANAGIWEHNPLDELEPDAWSRTFRTNVDGLVQTCRRAAAGMRDRGWGRIVIIGSTAGQRGEAEYSPYAASKGAVHLFAKSIGVELAPHGINVNVVAPGWVLTDMTRDVLEGERAEAIFEEIPRRCVATPEDIAGPVLFLCSPLADHLVGSVISVNGGSVL